MRIVPSLATLAQSPQVVARYNAWALPLPDPRQLVDMVNIHSHMHHLNSA